MLMMGARAFVVVVCARFINLTAWVPSALLVRMPGLLTMHMAGLKAFVFVHGGTLLVARIVAAPPTVATLIVLTPTISIDASHAARPVGPVMVCKMAELAIVALSKLFAHLVLCISSDLVKLMVLIITVVQLSIVDGLEVLRSIWSISLSSLQPKQMCSALYLLWKVI